jgi:hypothetical protein
LTGPPSKTFVPPIFDSWHQQDIPAGDDTVNRGDSSCDDAATSASEAEDSEGRSDDMDNGHRQIQGKEIACLVTLLKSS